MIDQGKSIEQLEDSVWPSPGFESNVVLQTHAMRRKPLAELSLRDISTGLLQQVGVSYVVPIAISLVEEDPFAESIYYPGDILRALLDIPTDFWLAHDNLRDRVQRVYERAEGSTNTQDAFWQEKIHPKIRKAHARFRGDLPSCRWLRPVANQQELGTWGSGKPR